MSIAHALSTSLDQCHLLLPARCRRLASSPHDDVRAAPDAARQELPERLAEACRRRVLGEVATRTWWPRLCSMLEEVTVSRLRQRDLGQPALQRVLLVAQLVGGVDADPAEHPDRQRQRRSWPPSPARRRSPASSGPTAVNRYAPKITLAYWNGM